MKINSFTLKKARSRRYPAQTITDADYINDIVLLANTPAQAESLLHSLQRTTGGIVLLVNAEKTEHICFNQRSDISTLISDSLKLVDKFIYFRSSVSSTENDVIMQLAKVWTTIDRLAVRWKSDLSDKIKRNFLRAAVVVNTTVWVDNIDAY